MKILIVLNGECKSSTYLFNKVKEYDMLLCADGGYNHIKKLNLKPDLVLGDFDSCEIPENVEILKFPKDKDLTDMEIAINYANKFNPCEITLTCATGGRIDHTMVNILSLSGYKNVNIKEQDFEIYHINDRFVIENEINKVVSIIPTKKSKVVLNGFKYPLNGEIDVGTTLTISNIVTSENAEIKVEYGSVIAIINHQI